jgi:surface polysaccharide O-acyltransferase-like enzyme
LRPLNAKARARRLLLPWLFWSVVYTVAILLFPPPYWQADRQVERLCWSWYRGAPVAALWFLWAAFGLSLLSHPLRTMVQGRSSSQRWALSAAALAAGATLEVHWTFVESWTLPFFLQWVRLVSLFLLGAALYTAPAGRSQVGALVALALAALPLHSITRHLVFDLAWGPWPAASELGRTGDWKLNFLSPARVLLNVSLFSLTRSMAPRLPRLPAPVAELTFGIYLTHTLWLDFVFPRWGWVATRLSPPWLFAIVALALLASTATTLLIRRLPGGRSVC